MHDSQGSLGLTSIYVPFAKIDAEQRFVAGYASTESRDAQGEIVRLDGLKRALPDYMRWANIREMHQPSAVGTAQEAQVDNRGLWVGATIVDNDAWAKVRQRVYKGFSLGGKVISRDPADRTIITDLQITEISLVDRPANPESVFAIVKRLGGQLLPFPTQVWACGNPLHQHRTKNAAYQCVEGAMRKANEAHTELARQWDYHREAAGNERRLAQMHRSIHQRLAALAAAHKVHASRARNAGDHAAEARALGVAARHQQHADANARMARSADMAAAQHDGMARSLAERGATPDEAAKIFAEHWRR